MVRAGDNLPERGPDPNPARTLSVRPQVDIEIDSDGLVHEEGGGLSVSPDSPENLPEHRRPPDYGGTGKDPVWMIDSEDLGDGLIYRDDPDRRGEHGFIEPETLMEFAEYEDKLRRTRDRWRKPES